MKGHCHVEESERNLCKISVVMEGQGWVVDRQPRSDRLGFLALRKMFIMLRRPLTQDILKMTQGCVEKGGDEACGIQPEARLSPAMAIYP